MKKLRSFIFACFFLATPLSLSGQEKPQPSPDDKSAPQSGKVPAKAKITEPIPGYQDYDTIGKQLEQWVQEAPGLTEIGSYGNSKKDKPLRYIRVTNLLDPAPKKKVLIHACIHSEETLACATIMAMIGTMLSEYGVQRDTTDLMNRRDIYFIPVVSPDYYPKGAPGPDPNQDFPHPGRPKHKSMPHLDALQKFFLKHQFDAAISGHTFNRGFFIYPYAERTEPPPHVQEFNRILGEMKAMCKYNAGSIRDYLGSKKFKASGLEMDWYYRNGAFSIVCEFDARTVKGTPTLEKTKAELDKTYGAFLYFIREGPLVDVRSFKENIKSDESEKSKQPKGPDRKKVLDKDPFIQLRTKAFIPGLWMRPDAFR